MGLVHSMVKDGLSPDLDLFRRALVECCASASSWPVPLSLFQEMERLHITPDTQCYSLVLAACLRADKTWSARGLLQHMRRHNIHPDLLTYQLTAQACTDKPQGPARNAALRLFR